MDKDFQDRIDKYLLGRMSVEEKAQFEAEAASDESKKKQLDFTVNLKRAITSREEKLAQLREFSAEYKRERHGAAASPRPTGTDECVPSFDMAPDAGGAYRRRRVWAWVSGIAAILIVGLFIVDPFAEPAMDVMRDGSDVIFNPVEAVPGDSVADDTIVSDTSKIYEGIHD